MKKNIFLTAALLMGLSFASVMLTSCDKEDNKASETPKKDTTPASVQMNFTFEATQDMLDYCDMVVKYDDGTGMKTETASTLEWTKSLKVSLPATLTFVREVSLKSGVEASDIASFSYLKGYRCGYAMMNAQGEQLGSLGSKNNVHRGSVSNPANIPNVIEMINAGRMNDSVTYSFDKNGSLVDQNQTEEIALNKSLQVAKKTSCSGDVYSVLLDSQIQQNTFLLGMEGL